MVKLFVSVVMGSDSDMETMREASAVLGKFGVAYELRILSAHRSPNLLSRYVRESEKRGVAVFIAGAGGAAALPGAVAALTSRPVLGVPIPSSSLHGLDSLLAIAQMPAGTPAAAFAIGAAGARNAAIMAVEILALFSPHLAAALRKFKSDQERAVGAKDAKARRERRK